MQNQTPYNNLQTALLSIDQSSMPEGLVDTIIARVEFVQKKRARVQVAIQGALVVLSSIGLFIAYRFAVGEFRASGFSQYFSIIFSDHDVALAYWKNFLVLLAESLPLLGTAVLLSTLFVLIGSLRSGIRNARVAFRSASAV